MVKGVKCPENITGRDTLEMTWRTRRVFWSRHLELVELLHPGQKNVHFSKGFGLSCFYVQLREELKICHVSYNNKFSSNPPLLELAVSTSQDGFWWSQLQPHITCPPLCVLSALGLRTVGQWVTAGQKQGKSIRSPDKSHRIPVQVDLARLLTLLCR